MREKNNGHKGCVIWFTGLSGSGKSTVANTLDHMLHQSGFQSVVLDGDNVRHGLNAGAAMLRDTHGDEFSERFGLGFTGIDDPYEEPRAAELVLQAAEKTPDILAEEIMVYLIDNGIISSDSYGKPRAV